MSMQRDDSGRGHPSRTVQSTEEQRQALDETKEWIVSVRHSSREYFQYLREQANEASARCEALRCQMNEVSMESERIIREYQQITSEYSESGPRKLK